MADLAEFLLERISEDEGAAGKRHAVPCGIGGWDGCNCGVPERVLAECEAKRRIVESIASLYPKGAPVPPHLHMKFLALPYADHPDFDPSWRDREDT